MIIRLLHAVEKPDHRASANRIPESLTVSTPRQAILSAVEPPMPLRKLPPMGTPPISSTKGKCSWTKAGRMASR